MRTQAALTTWRRVAVVPDNDQAQAIAYDSANQRTLLWGALQTSQAGMWQWDGSQWTEIVPPLLNAVGSSSVGGEFVMSYDAARGVVVLLVSGGTWEWDGAGWIRRDVTPAPTEARLNARLVYDSARERTVLFGGTDWSGTEYTDTWEWDGTSWTELTGAVSPPDGRAHMAYDAGREVVVLFGADGTWEWDGASWTQRTPSTEPPRRDRPALAYDAERQRIVMFGGTTLSEPRTSFRDTWAWDGNEWRELETATPAPGAGLTTYDAARGRVVVHFTSATWEFDGADWRERVRAPVRRYDASMAYDAARGQVVMFGGYQGSFRTGFDSRTWLWDGLLWQARSVPGPETEGPMAYDAARQKVLMYRDGGELWAWDGAGWTQVQVEGDAPQAACGMTYDSTRERVFLFDSAQLESWEWDGASWSLLPATTTPDWSGNGPCALAHDGSRQRTVMFSGAGMDPNSPTSDDTWEWDGTGWTKAVNSGVQSPPGNLRSNMVYDSLRGLIVAHAGWRRAGGVYEWDGAAWTSAGGEFYRQGVALSYDNARNAVVAFGGYREFDMPTTTHATWELVTINACTTTADCAVGSCVDGVCCHADEDGCGACQACNVAGHEGACAPIEGGCDDGDACTQEDICQAGACVGTRPLVCTAVDECHLDGECNPATGECSMPEALDGTACTLGSCAGGMCMSPVCDGGAACDDAGPQDAGPEDGGLEDAGPQDAGLEDAGLEDAGPQDASPQDGGPTDGSADAAATDAVVPELGGDAAIDASGMGVDDAEAPEGGSADAGGGHRSKCSAVPGASRPDQSGLWVVGMLGVLLARRRLRKRPTGAGASSCANGLTR